jgi:hypothetical protein
MEQDADRHDCADDDDGRDEPGLGGKRAELIEQAGPRHAAIMATRNCAVHSAHARAS